MNSDEEAIELKGQCVELLFECPKAHKRGARSAESRGKDESRKAHTSHGPDGRRGYEDQRAADRCPFRMVRELDVMERVKWLKGLSMEELRGLVAYHGECGKAESGER